MGPDSLQALIAEGRGAFERGEAEASRRAFEAALAERESGEVLEGLARALYVAADYPASIEAHERAFACFREEGDVLGAARAARTLSWLHLNVYGDFAVSAGWLGRAERLLADVAGEGAEHGWVELMRATQLPHGEERERRLRRAVEAGKRSGDSDLEFAALARVGETLVMTGRVEAGMAIFDESLAAACAGEVRDLYVIEAVFCGMLLTCERVHDVARAEQWLRAGDELIRRRNLLAIGPLCRSHYGGILVAAGRWDEAESELDQAARAFERGYDSARVIVLVRLGDLRVRQGRLEEAAMLLEGLDQVPDAARPLAALYLARGDTALARDLLERRLAAPASPAPWPVAVAHPAPPPVAAPLLALLVRGCLADGDIAAASEAAERLGELARAHPSPYLAACAALAHGQVCLASGSGDAKACLHEALGAFTQARMPVELARARLELAQAIAAERPQVAVAEAKAALDAFELRKATRDADVAAALLRSLGGAGRSAPRLEGELTSREREVLSLLGEGLSNVEIAERLVISPKTAEHHVGRILRKLELKNRSQAAAYALREADTRPGAK